MTDISETDFARIAAELRLASAEAARAAERDPESSEALRRKAEHLARAATRILADARAREKFILPNPGVDG
ncbi:MAG: hypothetical protein IRZ04_12825 [Rhodospirillales bacterium]|nr:hypothetical protein [Rhodospirillales bacterium]